MHPADEKAMARALIAEINRTNKAVLLAMGALFIASLNATKAMQKLQEVLPNETPQA